MEIAKKFQVIGYARDISPSDKWCQQGSCLTPASGGQTLTLKKAYKDTNYQVLGVNTDASNLRECQVIKVSATQVKVIAKSGTSASSTPCCWQASGYIA